MDEDLTFAYAVARALIKGKSTEELARLQIVLQTVSSLVTAELASQRLKATTEKPNG